MPLEINYLILAHKGPRQMARMFEKLETGCSNFYIHIDKDVDIAPFKKELNHYANVYFLQEEQRVSAIWADIGMVQATINCMRQVIAHQRTGYCVLISGQDYPIRSTQYRSEFLTAQYGINFVQGHPILPDGCPELGSRRINRYKVNLSKSRNDLLVFPSIYDREFYRKFTFKSFLTLAKRRDIKACLELIPKTLQKRKFPAYLQPFSGSQWWALPMETIYLIENFIHEHPDYLSYHQYTFAPDEIFFQSIIYSLVNSDLIREEITYVNWSQNTNGPLLLQEEHFEEIICQGGNNKLFARKFDIDLDSRILDLIDRESL
ncbi:beta-1,6-N-acetylglucosaminyltransferase [Paraflavitalea sp. CAU 1676]|uniref:beta-1,6-N-acetylglucosaminyltransferase n=1 Tax=Paraflavitalea sp. CAU 1676 TaxID=3032598 RepID=UPI0023DA3A45|nr:beta-1,6-N-acetylglucosaminyltransferase [Paraflavitalea sp. CAU 1676]MDF2188470.1 beta-1,6-N-acetylglucosaminyltransferase [Paraflavitalea sp. CAU 1676]